MNGPQHHPVIDIGKSVAWLGLCLIYTVVAVAGILMLATAASRVGDAMATAAFWIVGILAGVTGFTILVWSVAETVSVLAERIENLRYYRTACRAVLTGAFAPTWVVRGKASNGILMVDEPGREIYLNGRFADMGEIERVVAEPQRFCAFIGIQLRGAEGWDGLVLKRSDCWAVHGRLSSYIPVTRKFAAGTAGRPDAGHGGLSAR